MLVSLAIGISAFAPLSALAAEAEPVQISTPEELQAAVTNGGTYKVADGVETLDCSWLQLQIRGNVSTRLDLDLNGAEVIVDNDGFNFQNKEYDAAIKNGVINGTGNYAVKTMAKTPSKLLLENIETKGAQNGVASANSYYTIDIKDSKIYGTTTGIAATMGYVTVTDSEVGAITADNASTLSLSGSTINSAGSGIAAYKTASVSLDGCTVNADQYGAFWKSSGDLKIKDTQITTNANGKGLIHTDSTTAAVTIENAELSNTCETTAKAYLFSSNSTDASNITVNGGTYNGVFALNSASRTSLKIYGGLFSADPSKYLADGLGAFKNESGMYEIAGESEIPTTPPEETPDPDATPTTEPAATPAPTPTATPEPTPVPELALDTMFTSNMVLQRNKPVNIWGTGISGKTVNVSFNGSEAETLVEHGTWSVTLPAMDVVRSAELTVTDGENSITLTNVAVGDVILFSGQSNMYRDFNSFKWMQEDIDADYPDIRLYSRNTPSETWNTSMESDGWLVATKENAVNFSATGFMTAKRLYNNTDGEVPLGLIRAAYDGSNIMSWISESSAYYDPDVYRMYTGCQTKSKWYNQYIKPILRMSIAGVMWYQGEGNTWYKNNNYEKALTTLIESWRNDWNDESLPFVIVQLPTADFDHIYGNRTPASTGGFCTGIGVRDGQWQVSQKLDNVTTVVSIDTGRAKEVHPQDKKPIADRAAKAFEHYLMGNNTDAYLSPSYDRMEINEEGNAVIYFNNVYDKLVSKDGTEIKGFAAAGDGGEFNPVTAQISADGQSVIVNTSGIEKPQVRYAWSDTPSLDESNDQLYSNINLVNESGFAVAPFRTDKGKYMYMTDSGETKYCNFVPRILDITPENGSVTDGDITVSVKADDVDGEVTSVEIFMDEESAGFAEKTGDVWTLDITGLSDGTHTVYAVATDDSGAVSTKQDGSMGTEDELKPLLPNAFLVGAGKPEINKGFENPGEIGSEYLTVSGEGTEAGTGRPSGFFRDTLKLSANTAKGAAALTLPVDAEAGYNTIEFETSVYIESSKNANANDSSTLMELQMSDGASKTLFAFTNTSLRIGGNYYEILRAQKESGKWYDLKLVIDIHRGSFTAYVNGELMYSDRSWILQTKDFDKQYEWYQSLKEGVRALRITHTQSAADVQTATYIDGAKLTLSSYDNTPAAEPEANVSYENGVITAEVENAPSTPVIYAAAYDENGALMGIKMSEGDNVQLPFEYDNAAAIEVFIWDGMQRAMFAPFVIK